MFGQAIFGQAIFSQAIATRSQDLIGRLLPMPLPFVARAGFDTTKRRLESAQDDALLGRLGSLEVRLATQPAEIRRAQRLRYRIFFEEGPATATLAARLLRAATPTVSIRSASICWSSTTPGTIRTAQFWSAPTDCSDRKSRLRIADSTAPANSPSAACSHAVQI